MAMPDFPPAARTALLIAAIGLLGLGPPAAAQTPEPATPTVPTTPTVRVPEPTQPAVRVPEPPRPTVHVPEPQAPVVRVPEPSQPTVRMPQVANPTVAAPNPPTVSSPTVGGLGQKEGGIDLDVRSQGRPADLDRDDVLRLPRQPGS